MESLKVVDGRYKYVVEERVDIREVVERVERGGEREAWGVEGAFEFFDGDGDVEMC